MRKLNTPRGFTLIEVLVVIGIIAILASIVIIAINPQRQFQQANNTQRWSNVNAILNAVHQYAVDNHGQLPTTTPAVATEICKRSAVSCVGLVDLNMLVPTYVVDIPVDPTCGSVNGTCYNISTATGTRITVTAPSAELGQSITVNR